MRKGAPGTLTSELGFRQYSEDAGELSIGSYKGALAASGAVEELAKASDLTESRGRTPLLLGGAAAISASHAFEHSRGGNTH
jgi:hypothetical protein